MCASDDSTFPHDGDVLVKFEAKGRDRFTIRQVPGGPQINAPSLDRALWIARGFARRHAVDVWYSEAGCVRRLENYRNGPIVCPEVYETDRC